jgi:hypothetical protein
MVWGATKEFEIWTGWRSWNEPDPSNLMFLIGY